MDVSLPLFLLPFPSLRKKNSSQLCIPCPSFINWANLSCSSITEAPPDINKSCPVLVFASLRPLLTGLLVFLHSERTWHLDFKSHYREVFPSQDAPWKLLGGGDAKFVTECCRVLIFLPLSWCWQVIAKRVFVSRVPGILGFVTVIMSGRLCPTSPLSGEVRTHCIFLLFRNPAVGSLHLKVCFWP